MLFLASKHTHTRGMFAERRESLLSLRLCTHLCVLLSAHGHASLSHQTFCAKPEKTATTFVLHAMYEMSTEPNHHDSSFEPSIIELLPLCLHSTRR